MSKKSVPQTSKDALASLDPEKIGQIYKDIVMALRIIGPETYEGIAKHLKKDSDKIWKRMSELHRMGLVERSGKRKKMASGREGFVWTATDKLPNTEKIMPGRTVADFSKALIQPQMGKLTQEKLF